jgi:hypothetical protein
MNKTLSALILAGAFLTSSSAADAQTPQHKSAPSAVTANDMVGMCESMMREMMADPIVRKRMNAIMQKHMSSMMHGGMMHGGMMQGGVTHGGGMTHGGSMTPQPSPTSTR